MEKIFEKNFLACFDRVFYEVSKTAFGLALGSKMAKLAILTGNEGCQGFVSFLSSVSVLSYEKLHEGQEAIWTPDCQPFIEICLHLFTYEPK